eukprot:TRINITY_DN5485_c0_g2_i1.p1 TRINITY_DN5485_c0_g2~~TRINITY_DN5485_c0_g2_i1.p1  ORF type:complete len:223 (+),score=29.29 TRINITY_DN5485_c0_g2_i1:98-670(+)
MCIRDRSTWVSNEMERLHYVIAELEKTRIALDNDKVLLLGDNEIIKQTIDELHGKIKHLGEENQLMMSRTTGRRTANSSRSQEKRAKLSKYHQDIMKTFNPQGGFYSFQQHKTKASEQVLHIIFLDTVIDILDTIHCRWIYLCAILKGFVHFTLPNASCIYSFDITNSAYVSLKIPSGQYIHISLSLIHI